jgi:hypothetical protein
MDYTNASFSLRAQVMMMKTTTTTTTLDFLNASSGMNYKHWSTSIALRYRVSARRRKVCRTTLLPLPPLITTLPEMIKAIVEAPKSNQPTKEDIKGIVNEVSGLLPLLNIT